MPSFVEQVLQHLDQFEQKEIHGKVDALTSKLNEMTIEVHQLVETKYVDFKPNLGTSEKLEGRVEELQANIAELEDKIQNKINSQLSISTGEFQGLNSQLTEMQAKNDGLEHLTKIVSLLQDSEKALEEKLYSQAAKAISDTEALLKQPFTNQDDKIMIMKALKTEVAVRKAKLDCTLSDNWKEFVKWNLKTDKKSAQQEVVPSSVKEISLCVVCEGSSNSELRELVKALNHENLLDMQMKVFADRFKKFIVPLIIEYPQLSIDVSTSGLEKTLVIIPRKEGDALTTSSSKGAKSKSTHPDKTYVSVFANLNHIMTEFHSMLLSAEIGPSKVAAAGGDDDRPSCDTLMAWLGHECGTWTLDLLQKTLVAMAMPTSSKDQEGFDNLTKTVEMVHDKLSELGFIQPDNQILRSLVENIHMLFANKKSQSILVEARDLMTSGLHDNVAVTDDKPMGEWQPLTPGGVKKVQRLEVTTEHQLSDNTFRMPRCRISATVQTLITLAYDTLHEATDSSPECSLQMFLAVKSMFEMFCKVVPTHHGQSLETFPQIAALHHNNCMFISHHLMTLGHQFATKLPHLTSPTFVDLIQEIRENGVDLFLAQIRRQQDLLLECLEGAQGFEQLEDKARLNAAERSIKQVLLHLEHLQKIWKPVLPLNNYKKAMGRLINCAVKHITDSVCALEDIAQTAAQGLLSLLAQLESQCGEMLVVPGEAPSVELTRHVATWGRLVELRAVLDASLSEVGDRWAGGKGPLAVVFTPAELRQLVRALFQNTDRRANLLATIK